MFQALLALAGCQGSYSVEKLLFKVVGRNQPFLFRHGAQQATLLGAVPAGDQLQGGQARVLLQRFQQGDQELGVEVVFGGEMATAKIQTVRYRSKNESLRVTSFMTLFSLIC